jgi:hypothetical protein
MVPATQYIGGLIEAILRGSVPPLVPAPQGLNTYPIRSDLVTLNVVRTGGSGAWVLR